MSTETTDTFETDDVYEEAWNEGISAYKSGNSVNPYPEGSLQTHSWDECKKYLGWNDGSHHAPLVLMDEGEAAFQLDENLTANPYSPYSNPAYDWSQGWAKAANEALQEWKGETT